MKEVLEIKVIPIQLLIVTVLLALSQVSMITFDSPNGREIGSYWYILNQKYSTRMGET